MDERSVVPRRFFVIDASVSRVADRRRAHEGMPGASASFILLMSVMEHCRGFAASASVLREWERNESPAGARWRQDMALRDKFILEDVPPDTELRDGIRCLRHVSDSEKDIMLKDVHLIEAALAFDRMILSWDRQARLHFLRCASLHHLFKGVIWISPDECGGRFKRWIRLGADPEAADFLVDAGLRVPKSALPRRGDRRRGR